MQTKRRFLQRVQRYQLRDVSFAIGSFVIMAYLHDTNWNCISYLRLYVLPFPTFSAERADKSAIQNPLVYLSV